MSKLSLGKAALLLLAALAGTAGILLRYHHLPGAFLRASWLGADAILGWPGTSLAAKMSSFSCVAASLSAVVFAGTGCARNKGRRLGWVVVLTLAIIVLLCAAVAVAITLVPSGMYACGPDGLTRIGDTPVH